MTYKNSRINTQSTKLVNYTAIEKGAIKYILCIGYSMVPSAV